MSYFDGIEIGDKVWSFEYGWGTVVDILSDSFYVEYNKYEDSVNYDFNGIRNLNKNQTLFWNEIKFEMPKKPKIKLKYESINKYIKNGIYSEPVNTYEQLNRFYRLLALRDQECPDSRGYKITYNVEKRIFEQYYTISKDLFEERYLVEWHCEAQDATLFDILFKTEEDAQKICDILNSGRFDLEGD